MKKLNRKGFTLIELLAVITIMGILLLVAIPAVSRTIENTRRDTFASTAKSYVNALKNSIASDEIYYGDEPMSAAPDGYYCYGFTTSDDSEADVTSSSATDLMEQGGRSSWGNAHVTGYIAVHKATTPVVYEDEAKTIIKQQAKTKYEYAIFIVDKSNHGTNKLTLEREIGRAAIATKTNVDGVTTPDSRENVDVFDGKTLQKEGTDYQLPSSDSDEEDLVCRKLRIG